MSTSTGALSQTLMPCNPHQMALYAKLFRYRSDREQSIQIQRMRLEFFKLYNIECAFVRRGKDDARRDAGQECIFPTRDADAPFVAGL